MPRPICVSCRVEMRCVKNEQPVRDRAVGDHPATVWVGDRYQCPVCRWEVVTGFGGPSTGEPILRAVEIVHGEALEFRYARPEEVPA